MTDGVGSSGSTRKFLSDSGVGLTVYILYLIGFFTGITALVGAIVAHLYRRSASQEVATHFRFQIRTFWIGLIYFVLGSALWYFGIGIVLMLWWLAWTLLRVIRGMLLLNDGKPIPNPKSILFGGSETARDRVSSGAAVSQSLPAPPQPSGHSMLVLLVVAVMIAFLALQLGLVDAFWRGFWAGLDGRTDDL